MQARLIIFPFLEAAEHVCFYLLEVMRLEEMKSTFDSVSVEAKTYILILSAVHFSYTNVIGKQPLFRSHAFIERRAKP